MITKISIVAGDIWQILDKRPKAGISEMIKEIDAPRELVLMSIGWLAREGHIVLGGEGPDHEISLRKK